MNNKILTCAIEEIAQLHPNLFCEDVIVSAVAIMKNTGKSPCCFTIECRNIKTNYELRVTNYELNCLRQFGELEGDLNPHQF